MLLTICWKRSWSRRRSAAKACSSETEGNASDDLYVEGQLEFDIGERVDGWIRYGHAEWNQARCSTIATTPYDIAPTYFGGLFPNSTFNGTPTQPVSVPFTATNPSNNDHRLYNNDTPFRANRDGHHSFVMELIGHMDWADLKYVGGYASSIYSQVSDYDTIDRGPYRTVAGGVPFTIFPQVEAFYMEDKDTNCATSVWRRGAVPFRHLSGCNVLGNRAVE